MRSHIPASFLLALLACQAQAETTPFPGVEKLMSAEQYRAAGLEKLSVEERAALNRWLIDYTVKEAPVMRRDNTEVREAEEKMQIRASINQPFSGWDGNTTFYLDNGQVWRQRMNSRYPYSGEDTAVIIEKNFMGFYKMTLVATGKAVGVSRIK